MVRPASVPADDEHRHQPDRWDRNATAAAYHGCLLCFSMLEHDDTLRDFVAGFRCQMHGLVSMLIVIFPGRHDRLRFPAAGVDPANASSLTFL